MVHSVEGPGKDWDQMSDDKLTPKEADEVLDVAVDASIERDVAINAAARATVNEAAAREDARAQGADARDAKGQAAQMDTLRRVANSRANQEAQSAETSRFGLYLLIGIIMAGLLVAVVWMVTRPPQANVTVPSGGAVQGQSGQMQPVVVIPGPQGAQGPQGPSASQGASGPSGPSGKPGPAGPSGASGPAGPSGASGTSAPDSAPLPEPPPVNDNQK